MAQKLNTRSLSHGIIIEYLDKFNKRSYFYVL